MCPHCRRHFWHNEETKESTWTVSPDSRERSVVVLYPDSWQSLRPDEIFECEQRQRGLHDWAHGLCACSDTIPVRNHSLQPPEKLAWEHVVYRDNEL